MSNIELDKVVNLGQRYIRMRGASDCWRCVYKDEQTGGYYIKYYGNYIEVRPMTFEAATEWEALGEF